MAREPFVWGQGGTKLTPKQIEDRRKVAQALMAKGADFSPAGHWTEALGRAFNGWIGGRQAGEFNRQEEAGTAAARAKMEGRYSGSPVAAALAGSGGGGYVPPQRSPYSMGQDAEQPLFANEITPGGLAMGAVQGGPTTKEEFIAMIAPAAIAEGQRIGVDPRIIIAQAAQETGWGKSAPNNNYFGIKSHGQAGGGSFATTEYINGQPVTITDSFRGYGSPEESVAGYASFLTENPRYQPMLAASGDFDAQIAALGRSGYATDPNYASSVRAIAQGIDLSPYVGMTSAPQMGGGSQEILGLMADPWVQEQYGSVLGAELGAAQSRENAIFQQQLAMQDPAYQLGLERQQLELEQMRNPGKKPPIEVGGVLLDADTLVPVFDSRQPSAPSAPETQVFYDEATGQEYRAQWNPASMSWDRIGGTKAPSGPDTVVNNNMGGDKFAEEVGKNQASAFNEMSASGFSAAQNLGNLDRLESLLAQGPSGASAALQNLAASYGIPVGSAGPLQAANALIQAMIPAQRPAGSGPMSDKDIEMFKASLPRLINSPEGNALIIQTLRGIAQYDMQRAEIADRAMLPPEDPNHLPRNEASKMLRQLQSPLSDFGKNASQFKAPETDANAIPDGIDAADWEYMTPEERALFQ